jgi:hypothetical protein
VPNRMLRGLIGVSILCLLQLGCSYRIVPDAPIQRPPLVQAVPLTVGVYYSQDLEKYECETGKGYIFEKFAFGLGPASIKLYDLVFSGLFARTFRVYDYRPSMPDKQEADVVELTITGFTGCEARWPIIGVTYVTITYRAILRAPSGKQIAEWIGTGAAAPSEGGNRTQAITERKYLEAQTAIAMRKAAANFVTEFQQNPDIKAWIESRGVLRDTR